MNERDDTDQLERLFDRALHELPVRRAPPTLEARVFDELARRMARPWWRQSFAYWPRSARAVFFAVCGALIGLAFVGCDWIVAGAGSLSASLVRAIPPIWLYEGVAVAMLLYAMLFALGAAAYRTLWADL
jgi:hypothetical protein